MTEKVKPKILIVPGLRPATLISSKASLEEVKRLDDDYITKKSKLFKKLLPEYEVEVYPTTVNYDKETTLKNKALLKYPISKYDLIVAHSAGTIVSLHLAKEEKIKKLLLIGGIFDARHLLFFNQKHAVNMLNYAIYKLESDQDPLLKSSINKLHREYLEAKAKAEENNNVEASAIDLSEEDLFIKKVTLAFLESIAPNSSFFKKMSILYNQILPTVRGFTEIQPAKVTKLIRTILINIKEKFNTPFFSTIFVPAQKFTSSWFDKFGIILEEETLLKKIKSNIGLIIQLSNLKDPVISFESSMLLHNKINSNLILKNSVYTAHFSNYFNSTGLRLDRTNNLRAIIEKVLEYYKT